MTWNSDNQRLKSIDLKMTIKKSIDPSYLLALLTHFSFDSRRDCNLADDFENSSHFVTLGRSSRNVENFDIFSLITNQTVKRNVYATAIYQCTWTYIRTCKERPNKSNPINLKHITHVKLIDSVDKSVHAYTYHTCHRLCHVSATIQWISRWVSLSVWLLINRKIYIIKFHQ